MTLPVLYFLSFFLVEGQDFRSSYLDPRSAVPSSTDSTSGAFLFPFPAGLGLLAAVSPAPHLPSASAMSASPGFRAIIRYLDLVSAACFGFFQDPYAKL